MFVLTYQAEYGVVLYTLEKKIPGELTEQLARVSKAYSGLTGVLLLHLAKDGWREAAEAIDSVRQYWDGGYDNLLPTKAQEHKAIFLSWMRQLID